ncbi:right-handed parallel beta-helix repeat-containing protein [Amycolatopsis circi]|uniref:right-handed parallel beta-helix repeat-containing protein n=1 Tax=Amycolatopsis circi TaxID=871959 RepID=UPI0013BEA3ED|nr:right-handed parallel beta-helix repeat-containing protein [Amycolatopsis circi]
MRKPLTLAAAVILAAAATAAIPGTASATGTTYYVDCAGGNDANSGTSTAQAWKTLGKASAAVFHGNDKILLKRGTQCAGTLAPKGSGTASQPIGIGAYGSGAKPKIAAGGALAAVLLQDVQGWEVRDLDLSNTGSAPQATDVRFGVYVLLTDFGVGHHYIVQNVDVHDVNGCDCQNPHQLTPSGGIGFKAAGANVPTAFDDISVDHDTITKVDRQGIVTSSDWEKRPEYPQGRGASFQPITGLKVHDNILNNIGGDGIAVFNSTNALVESNVLRDFAQRSAEYSAGMYAYNSDNTTFRSNDASSKPGPLPAQPYYFETANNGTVFEYNYSQNNSGGAMGMCNDVGVTAKNNVFRYNVSQNDSGTGSYPWGDHIGVVTLLCGSVTGMSVYGNTFYSTTAERLVANAGAPALNFTDNIFVGRAAGSAIDDPSGTYDHNVYDHVTNVPASDKHALVVNPMLLNPGTANSRTTAGGYRLSAGSPALSAGTPVPNNGGRDYFTYPIPADKPSIGAYAGPTGVKK